MYIYFGRLTFVNTRNPLYDTRFLDISSDLGFHLTAKSVTRENRWRSSTASSFPSWLKISLSVKVAKPLVFFWSGFMYDFF